MQSPELEAAVLNSLEGGFEPADFEIMQRLGHVSVQQVQGRADG